MNDADNHAPDAAPDHAEGSRAVSKPVQLCRTGWWDGKSGHTCGEPAGHDGPHICASDKARYGSTPAVKEEPNHGYGYFAG